MTPYQISIKLRSLKHGSEEEYDLFQDIAVCLARNKRMNGAANSQLQLLKTPGATSGDPNSDISTISTELAAAENSSSDGKCSQEDETNAILSTAAASEDLKERHVGHPHGDDRVCIEGELTRSDAAQSPSSSDFLDGDPIEKCSEIEGEDVDASLLSAAMSSLQSGEPTDQYLELGPEHCTTRVGRKN